MGIVLARLLMPEDFGRFAYMSAVVTALMIPFGATVTPLLVTDGGRNPALFGNVLGFMCITSVLKLIVLSCFIIYQLASQQPSQALLAFLIGFPVAIFDVPDALRADLEGQGRFGPNLAVQFVNLSPHAFVSISLGLLGLGVDGGLLQKTPNFFRCELPFKGFSCCGRVNRLAKGRHSLGIILVESESNFRTKQGMRHSIPA